MDTSGEGKPITDPWDCYIYLHEWLVFNGKFIVNVGKHTIHGCHGKYNW